MGQTFIEVSGELWLWLWDDTPAGGRGPRGWLGGRRGFAAAFESQKKRSSMQLNQESCNREQKAPTKPPRFVTQSPAFAGFLLLNDSLRGGSCCSCAIPGLGDRHQATRW